MVSTRGRGGSTERIHSCMQCCVWGTAAWTQLMLWCDEGGGDGGGQQERVHFCTSQHVELILFCGVGCSQSGGMGNRTASNTLCIAATCMLSKGLRQQEQQANHMPPHQRQNAPCLEGCASWNNPGGGVCAPLCLHYLAVIAFSQSTYTRPLSALHRASQGSFSRSTTTPRLGTPTKRQTKLQSSLKA